MKSRILAITGLVSVLGIGTAVGFAQQRTAAPITHGPRMGVRREKHPELRMALRALTRAHGFLNKGARDFNGHRAKAEQLTAQAISETQAAIEDDQR